MADNTAALQFIAQKITGLQVVQQALTNLYTQATDLDISDAIRAQLTRLNEELFALQSERNAMADTSNVVPPPAPGEIQALNDILKHLDAYVHTDQNVHMAINYLQQVADQIKGT
jgi:hypothetical protein